MITSERKNQIEVLEQSGSPAPAARVVPSEQLWLPQLPGGAGRQGGTGGALAPVELERSKLLAALPLRQPPDGFGEWGIGD